MGGFHHSHHRLAILLGTLVLVSAALTGCGGDDDEDTTAANTTAPSGTAAGDTAPGGGGAQGAKPGVFVGPVEGTGNSIALVTDGSRLTGAYLCVQRGAAQWIKPAPLQNGSAPLVARRGAALGEVTFGEGGANGNLNVGGSLSFSAKPATGYAGLYRTTSGKANEPGFEETGWIALPNGDVCGRTNSVTAGGEFRSERAPSTPDGDGRITDFGDPFPF